ncbi:MAG TPA: LpxL/LpxP family Kdo(2)-lipid IV(A) lauroyl/palmitoleoyl acyltransferase [Xanthomonadales bacterium]|nr:LpxL/LpxP family Kdo(2)-lipid IV(A) lauroyl/palmitoleoyl acyltransferase [Xanthomonadales bacterium]
MPTQPQALPPLSPPYWPSWLGVGVLWLLGKTPQWPALVLAVPLGNAMRWAMKSRRRIAQRNIERCFPELDTAQREAILRDCFRSLARAVFEIAWSWSASERYMRRVSRVNGREHVVTAHRDGRGVLLVTAHLSCLEIGARLMVLGLGPELPASGIYRPLRNPVLEWYQNRGRRTYAASMISKRDMRSAIRLLREGGLVWYAPDQDFGREQSVFAPFFGIQTATLLATHRLAQITGCAVVPMFPVYDAASRTYTVRFLPALDGFPGPDASADLARVNAIMEAQIRSAPGQYWWIHRRFKTRPDGESPFYG